MPPCDVFTRSVESQGADEEGKRVPFKPPEQVILLLRAPKLAWKDPGYQGKGFKRKRGLKSGYCSVKTPVYV